MSQKVFSANLALPERTTSAYLATFRDPRTNAQIPGSAITSILLTLVDVQTGQTLNNRTNVEVLGGDALVSEAGELTLTLQADDLVMVGEDAVQQRRMNLTITYTDGVLPHVVTFYVTNLPGVG